MIVKVSNAQGMQAFIAFLGPENKILYWKDNSTGGPFAKTVYAFLNSGDVVYFEPGNMQESALLAAFPNAQPLTGPILQVSEV